MAEIIRPQGGSILDQSNINIGSAASTANAAQGVGNSLVSLGKEQSQDARGTMNISLGNAIANESTQQLSEANDSIRSSIYADRMTKATKEFLTNATNRSSQVTDKNGMPLFGSLVQDVGTLGKETLEKYLADVTDPALKEQLTANFNSQVANSQLQAMSTAKNQQKDFAAASYASLKDVTLKQAQLDNINNIPGYVNRLEEVLRSNVASGLMSAAEAQQELQTTDRNLRVGHVQQAIEANPYAALAEITGDDGTLGLASDDLLKLKKEAQYGVAKEEAIKASKEKALKEQYQDLFNEVKATSKRGNSINADLREYLIESSRGTVNEGEVDKLLAQNEVARNFSLLSIADQQAFLREADANGTSNPDMLGASDLLHDILDSHLKSVKEDPTQYAVDKGFIQPTERLDFSQGVEGVQDQIEQKFQNAQGAKALVGKDVTGMTIQDTKDWTAWFKTLSPVEQSKAAQDMVNKYGTAAPAFMDSLQVSGNATLAGDIYTRTQDPLLADDLTQGEAIIKAGDISMPTDAVFTESLQGNIPLSANQALNSKRIRDIKRLVAIEIQNGNMSADDISTSNMEMIIQRAIPSIERNGVKVPVGTSKLTPDQVNNSLDNISDSFINDAYGTMNPNLVYGDETPSSIIRNAVFHEVAPGIVVADTQDGDRITTTSGREMYIDFSKLPINVRPNTSNTLNNAVAVGAAPIKALGNAAEITGKKLGAAIQDLTK